MSRPLTTLRVAPLLFGSGLCSLVYQVGWLREFRLVFGASTSASAAVLAIFIGGLGLGSWLLGKRADAAPNPLALYARLELVIAASAALSPLLLGAVRAAYTAVGGTTAVGLGVGTAVRLVLAGLVLAVPTVAMGGTLAAVTRAVSGDADVRRRRLALLYGTNTLGAVVGAMLATFFMLEVFGTQRTIWVAALINVLVAMTALRMSRGAEEGAPAASPEPPPSPTTEGLRSSRMPVPLVLLASGLVGFVFFLMEMTWYRMLGPILGGTVFTFGLILALALLGIGLGGLVYALFGEHRPATVHGLGLTCLLEALGLAVAWALGDRIAYAAGLARAAAVLGFTGQVAAWALICAVVMLPAAIASGVQFPLLVNLVGKGRAEVGRQLGLVYASNTIGAIMGSLLGGFVLLPGLGAPRCWQLAAVLLLVLGVAAIMFAPRADRWRGMPRLAALAGLVLVLLTAQGPTAVWRHSGIGAGRAAVPTSPSAARGFQLAQQRKLVWEAEGLESSVALVALDGLAFVVNGKIDGNMLQDAGTQMMGGLVGAALHPAPRRALVIGLGTGETAGWLADYPGMERVDVVELEPAILEVARRGASVNRGVLSNPKVHVVIGDAREVLLTTSARYDLIFSEPSNPYRAGVSSLYTREFYAAARERLAPGGLFLQWTQAYEVDGTTIATICATLAAEIPSIHLWRLMPGDLLFVASVEPPRFDAAQLAARVAGEPLATALSYSWHVEGTEGLLSHYLGGPALIRELVTRAAGDLNTDDRTLTEFAFARTLGQASGSNEAALRSLAATLEDDRPMVVGAVDWGRFEELRAFADERMEGKVRPSAAVTGDRLARTRARSAYIAGNPGAAIAAWRAQPEEPTSQFDRLLRAEGLAFLGDEAALADIARLRAARPGEADLLMGLLQAKRGLHGEAADALIAGFTEARRDPLTDTAIVTRALQTAGAVARLAAPQAPRLLAAISRPFALYLAEGARVTALLPIASAAGERALLETFVSLEPNVPWSLPALVRRLDVYRTAGHPLTDRAQDDLHEFVTGQAQPLMGTTSPIIDEAPAAAGAAGSAATPPP